MPQGFLGIFNRPIPGQSLTRPVGSSPTQRPPTFADPAQALEYIWGVLCSPRMATRLFLILKKGVSAEYIARTICFQGFAMGKWTPDIGLLIVRTVIYMIYTLGKVKGIKVPLFNEDKEQKKFLDKFMDMAPDDNDTDDSTSKMTSNPNGSDTAVPDQLAGGIFGGA